jgi:prolipoprotein diacylglyceryltransferase
MFSAKFIIFLAVGTAAMLIPLILYGRQKQIKLWKSVAVAIMLTVTGTIGTYVMGLIENQFRFGSRSFYGAVFLIPPVFLLIYRALQIPYGKLMDMSAPSVCIMLVLMKVLCCLEGCCEGRVMVTLDSSEVVRFPSQIVELIVALILFAVLLKMAYKDKYYGYVYPWYMLIYGAVRFIMNFLRANTKPFVWILPAGHFWSLIAITVGGLWIILMRKRKARNVSICNGNT